jgi:hypothetical protein
MARIFEPNNPRRISNNHVGYNGRLYDLDYRQYLAAAQYQIWKFHSSILFNGAVLHPTLSSTINGNNKKENLISFKHAVRAIMTPVKLQTFLSPQSLVFSWYRFGQRIDASAATCCPYQGGHNLTELQIMPLGQYSTRDNIDGFIYTSLVDLYR